MIDAYEIGIKLALQDDVSAGLAVVSRELAEVDRAIAATSAALVQLARLSGSVGKAISTGEVRRGTAEPAAGLPAGTVQQSATPPAAPERGGGAADGSPRQLAADVERQIPPDRAEAVSIPQPAVAGSDLRAATPERIVSSPLPRSEPVVARLGPLAPAGVALDGPSVSSVPAAPVTAGEVVKRRADRSAPDPVPTVSAVAVPVPVVAASPGQVRGRLEVNSSISQRNIGEAGRDGSRARAPRPEPAPIPSLVLSSPASLAPWSEPRSSGPRGQVARSVERAAAPQAAPREQAESGGGTVMLDGRLVGYWLTEQMARDASRPSSGTTHFDPRQGPAWTVSGAI